MSFSNTHDTTNPGSAVSNRQDLTSIVSVLEPEKTPFKSLCSTVKATATFHEWTVDDLDDPKVDGVREGQDISNFDDKYANRARLGNYIVHQRRTWKVSKLQEAANSVGPADFAHAKLKAMKELSRDCEKTLLGTQDRAQENGTTTGYQCRGLADWIDSAGPSDVPADYRTPANSIHASGALTESIFNDIITSMFIQDGEVHDITLLADTNVRRIITEFTRAEGSTTAKVYNVNEDATTKKITHSVSMYESDHGYISIINGNPKCMPKNGTAPDYGFMIKPSYCGIAQYLPMGSQNLEDQGGGPRGYIDQAFTLQVKHPAAFGKITDTTA